jgi:hypothetical protein
MEGRAVTKLSWSVAILEEARELGVGGIGDDAV